ISNLLGYNMLNISVLVLLVANVSFCQAETVEEYFRVGGTLQLSPQPVGGAITSIVWKYGKNLLAEWETKQIPLTYYSKFKGRTTLNTGTGELEIRNMTAADNEVYTVEINNHVQSRVHKTVAIEDVPQPVLEAKPLSCSSASKDCKLVCEGNVSKAGPVEYFWKKDDGEWEKSKENTMEIINDAETQRVKKFSCRIKNQFSEKESNALDNPFYREETTKEPSSPGSGVIVGIVLLFSICFCFFSVILQKSVRNLM
uniref:Ig-like domain-containing protein n=1 Tax=Maylandia zebra TaxID=106582 RepID=A0A3P9B1M9_9CICH